MKQLRRTPRRPRNVARQFAPQQVLTKGWRKPSAFSKRKFFSSRKRQDPSKENLWVVRGLNGQTVDFVNQQFTRPQTPFQNLSNLDGAPTSVFEESWRHLISDYDIDTFGSNDDSPRETIPTVEELTYENSWCRLISEMNLDTFGTNDDNRFNS